MKLIDKIKKKCSHYYLLIKNKKQLFVLNYLLKISNVQLIILMITYNRKY